MVLDCLRVVVDVFEVVVDGCRWLLNFFEVVVGGFWSFQVLVTTPKINRMLITRLICIQ